MKLTHILLKMPFLLGFIFSAQITCATEQKLFTGTIQWPMALESTPGVRVYHAGRKIVTTIHNEAHRVSFTIPENKTIFYIIITPHFHFVPEDNVVKYLTLNPQHPCKVYMLELVAHETHGSKPNKFSLTSLDKNKPSYWIIKEITAPTPQARLPDDSIIVYLNPAWVQGLEGGSPVDLPKIVIRPDVINVTGSEEKLHDEAAAILLAALNTDTIHGSIDQEIRVGSNPKTILAFNI